jgi:hypothetical protein
MTTRNAIRQRSKRLIVIASCATATDVERTTVANVPTEDRLVAEATPRPANDIAQPEKQPTLEPVATLAPVEAQSDAISTPEISPERASTPAAAVQPIATSAPLATSTPGYEFPDSIRVAPTPTLAPKRLARTPHLHHSPPYQHPHLKQPRPPHHLRRVQRPGLSPAIPSSFRSTNPNTSAVKTHRPT